MKKVKSVHANVTIRIMCNFYHQPINDCNIIFFIIVMSLNLVEYRRSLKTQTSDTDLRALFWAVKWKNAAFNNKIRFCMLLYEPSIQGQQASKT